MNKFKKAAVSFGIATAMVLGMGAAATVAAEPASAMSYGQCFTQYGTNGRVIGRMQYIHYNWWERNIQWKNPGYVFIQGAGC